ncbi:HAD-IA family hydrolase [Duganella sp. HH101]|uniref:HAD-IA family hydrolase n=1 Tax=Duganella sp. HH101 TaxID=1781066 RepID=UPI0008744447|nr:HAD-IA family hydrolase [Duganella sp. HH101]OFA00170.1 phosphoglycolate phosphatase [Duganella sp. HH101]
MAAVRCVLFDLDNTLAPTERIRDIRESHDYDALTQEVLAPIKPYKQVQQLLEKLTTQGVKLGIVTNSGRKYASVLLDHLGIGQYFSTVVTYTDVKAAGAKPSPTGLKLALERLGVPANKDVLYVGDTNEDIEAAYAAGVTPILASWASKKGTSLAPAIELSSTMLSDHFSDPSEYRLFAERCAELGTAAFKRNGVYFLPLDDDGNVVTMEDELSTFCLGRYFGQKSEVSAVLHDSHALSKEIIKKDETPNYELPGYVSEMVAHVIKAGGESRFGGGKPFDIVTVIPAKGGKHPRLENLLAKVQAICVDTAKPVFVPDLFQYSADARSQKTLGRNERHMEASRSLHINVRAASVIEGKRVLVIDDVITTGSTMARARELVTEHGAEAAFGVALAKTVSVAAHEKDCPSCGRSMLIKKHPTTKVRFWGCSGFRDEASLCKHTEPFYKKPCPKCGRDMVVKPNSRTGVPFWGCTGYRETPQCSHAENFTLEKN